MRQRIVLSLNSFLVGVLISLLGMGPVFAAPPRTPLGPGDSWVYDPQRGWGLTNVENNIRVTFWYGGVERSYPVANGGPSMQAANPSAGPLPGGGSRGGVVYGGTLYYNPGLRLPPPLYANPTIYRSPFIELQRANWAAQANGAIRTIVLNPGVKVPQLNLPTGPDLTQNIQMQKEWIESIAKTLSAPKTAPLVSKYVSAPMRAVADRNPFALAESMDAFFGQVKVLDSLDPALASTVMRVGEAVFMDSQGVISGLPDAPRPIDLVSPVTSTVGRSVRHNLNRMLVSRQILEGEFKRYCSLSAESCLSHAGEMEQVRDMFDQLALANGLAERLGLANDPAYQILAAELEKAAAFTFGFAKGVYGSAEAMVEGLWYLVSHNPITTGKNIGISLGDAIVNYDRTFKAISGVIEKKWHKLIYGTAMEQGEVLGEVTTEVVATLLPGLKAAGGAARGLKAAATLERGVVMAEKIGAVVEAGTYGLVRDAVKRASTRVAIAQGVDSLAASGQMAAENARMVKALSRALPETAAEILKLDQSGLSVAKLEGVAQASLKDFVASARADSAAASLVSSHGADAANLLAEYGPEVLAGAKQAFGELTVDTLKSWKTSSSATEMAEMAKAVSRKSLVAPKASTEGLKNLFELEGVLKREGATLTKAGREFFALETLNSEAIWKTEQRVVGTLPQMTEDAKLFSRLETAISDVKATVLAPDDSTVWRGILKERIDNGITYKYTENDVFSVHSGNLRANHRFGQPGELTLSTTMGDAVSAKNTIIAELSARAETPIARDAVIFSKMTVQPKSVLDLTDPSVLSQLGIKDATFYSSYRVSHQLDFLARQKGFDAIRALSARGEANTLTLLLDDTFLNLQTQRYK